MSDTERECAWTGESSSGKHYILRTTEGRGEELVSAAALPRDLAAQLDHLHREVNRLRKRVSELEGDAPTSCDAAVVPAPRRAGRRVPAQGKRSPEA